MPSAGSELTANAYLYSENTLPYPSALQGTIKLSRVVPSVFDFMGTSIAPAVDGIPRTGGRISLTAGSNDTWSIMATNGLSPVPVAPKGAQYEVNTVLVTIPEIEEIHLSYSTVLDIDLYYIWNGQQVKAATYHQNPYRLHGSIKGEIFDNNLYGVKDIATLNISGDYPDLFVRMVSENEQMGPIYPVQAGTNDTFRFEITENMQGDTRRITAEYSTDGINWYLFQGISQYPNNYYYTNFFYGKENVEYNNSPLMTGAEAMGINTQFNEASYYNT